MFQDIFQRLDGEIESASGSLIGVYKEAIKQGADLLADKFHDGADVADLVHARADLIDGMLKRAWEAHLPDGSHAALVAVGGYGRGELHPASDVDVLILTRESPATLAHALEPFVMFLWDIGLEVGHSVRNVEQCIEEARANVTVVTNLVESRALAGDQELFEEMLAGTSADKIWPSDAFFSAKLEEQESRYAKVDDSSHDLEPNIKTNPGGLRDIQMIGWVAKRHFGVTRLSEIKEHGFLTEHEYETLIQGESFLWQIRFALHLLTGRHEDRLLFEHQRALAKQFGYTDENTNLAVEQFMQQYYRTAVTLQRLNEMLLQLFNEVILLNNELGEPKPINRRFQARGAYIEAINPAIFARYPLAMLEIFLLLQQHQELKGVRASTIRSIRAHRHLIDNRLRKSIAARSLFMEILRQPRGITHELRRMHRYGVLARYIPAFHKITGLMQFDLFHVYTVDEHILMVVRNLRRFALEKHRDECPRCNERFALLPKPELLYLGGLFHDIAKGRGGDHCTLGSADAYEFCRQHDLSEYDSKLVAWLVEQHLIMSATAQRKDIDDPEVIQEFAKVVGTVERLDYLYLLTGADMRGTNPKRWNSWKGALLDRLHQRTREALQRGLDRPQDEDQLIQAAQEKARSFLADTPYTEEQLRLCWMQLSTDYFLQTPADTIAWHTRLLLENSDYHERIQVFMREDPERGCSEIFTVGPDRDGLFAETAAKLDQMGINILGARVDTSNQGASVNSYFVLEEDGEAIDIRRREEVLEALRQILNDPQSANTRIARRMPRALKSFMQESEINIAQDKNHTATLLSVLTHDRPGLLAIIGTVLAEEKVRLHRAAIVTEGAVARDTFTLTDCNNQPLTDEESLTRLRSVLQQALDD
jgi:[protein-PII] uridylyltransferase